MELSGSITINIEACTFNYYDAEWPPVCFRDRGEGGGKGKGNDGKDGKGGKGNDGNDGKGGKGRWPPTTLVPPPPVYKSPPSVYQSPPPEQVHADGKDQDGKGKDGKGKDGKGGEAASASRDDPCYGEQSEQ